MDADIEGAFDNIDHDYLLATIGDVPGRELIRQWLKVGYVDKDVFHPTEAGTPQGGVISPLLANIALHGMEEALGVTYNFRGQITGTRAVVRYADDFVAFCETEDDANRVVTELECWLADRGLTLSTEKTRVVHLTEGFDFLGFTVRHYKDAHRTTGYKLHITPSKASVQNIRDKLKAEWKRLQGSNAAGVVQALNPIIRGQANYYRVGVARWAFHYLDHWMFWKEVRYVRRMHPNRPTKWTKPRYWGRLNNDNWVFGDKDAGYRLLKYGWFGYKQHALVRGRSSPDDPTLRDYWERRAAKEASTLPMSRRKVATRQRHRCEVCRESLYNGEELHLHHIVPRSKYGKDTPDNLVLRHLYCHQQVHANMGSVKASDLLEPDAVKVARPVLRGGEPG